MQIPFLTKVMSLCAAIAFSMSAQAQGADDAERQLRASPFTVMSALPPGGPVDLLARVLSTYLQEKYGQPSAVENVPGAGGNVALDRIKRARNDGHALLVVGAGTLTINPSLMKNFPFNVDKDFSLVTMLAKAPNVLVANPGTGFKNVRDVIASAKAKPGGLQFASPGTGSGLHLAGEMLKKQAEIDIVHVPYKGSGQALADVIGGHVPLMMTNIPAVLPYLADGRLVALGLTDANRSPVAPNVATMAEQGVANVVVTSWYGVIAPAGVPMHVLQQLARDAADALSPPAVKKQLTASGMTEATSQPDRFAEYVRQETDVWRETIRQARIPLE